LPSSARWVSVDRDDIEGGHRLVATMMLISAATVALSQHWFLAIRKWVSAKVAPGAR
jgi:hypothetical protein